jgi:hypothetical protein
MGYIKAWLLPGGDVIHGFSEHAEVAKAKILGVMVVDLYPYGGPKLWKPLTAKDVRKLWKNKDADREGLKFLTTVGDPRTFMVMRRGWIRADLEKDRTVSLNLFRFDDETLGRIRNAEALWQLYHPDPGQMVSVDEMETNKVHEFTFGRLMSPSSTADALKHHAASLLSQYRNPPPRYAHASQDLDGNAVYLGWFNHYDLWAEVWIAAMESPGPLGRRRVLIARFGDGPREFLWAEPSQMRRHEALDEAHKRAKEAGIIA